MQFSIGAPFRDFPLLSFALVSAVLALGLGTIFAPRLSSFFFRNSGKLAASAIAILIIGCVGIYGFSRNIYKDAVALRKEVKTQRQMRQVMRDMGAASRQGKAPDVAYYRYLDKERADSLYAQIEPEWLDKQSVVTDSSSTNAKVGVGTGPVTGEIGKTGTQQKQTTREAASVTPEKKCRVLMQYASEQKGARSYATGVTWLITNIMQVTNEYLMKPQPEVGFGSNLPLNRTEMQELRLSGAFEMDNSPQTKEEINKQLSQRNWPNMLESELTNLPLDFVFVSGDFRISTSGALLLVHDFVGVDRSLGLGVQFRPVQFDVKFPPETIVPDLHDGSQKLTVFGKTVHGLDQNGTIEIRAVAVY